MAAKRAAWGRFYATFAQTWTSNLCILVDKDVYLTGFEAHSGEGHYAQSRPYTRSWLAVTAVCFILLALLAVVQVAHLHSNESDADHCPLCVVMHSAAPVAVAAAIVVLVQVGSSAPVAEPAPVFRKRQSRLFIRPPPTGC